MKKITLVIMLFSVVAMNAQLRKWQGSQTEKLWDYATPNWLNPASPLPIPATFSEGYSALFDDSILRDGDTLSVSGTLSVDTIRINASKTYCIRAANSTDSIGGTGAFIKEGDGLLAMDVLCHLDGPTILRGGTMRMEKNTSPNIFGSKLVFEGGIANFGTSSSSTYPDVTVPIEIPEGQTASIELSRYSYWKSKISGAGNLHVFVGGERTYCGERSKQADWSEFTGNVKVDKYELSGLNPGYYALMLNTNITFLDSLDGYNFDSTMVNRTLELGPGVCLTSESGNRSYLIGELIANDTSSVIAGYYKKSTSPNIKYFIGGLNTDVDLYAQFNDPPGVTNRYNKVSMVKVGTGTYRLLNNNSNMIGGLIVQDGTVLADDQLLRGNFRGSVGNNVIVKERGTIGGKGRIQGNVDVLGTLKPGSNGVGRLMICDTLRVADGTPGPGTFNLNMKAGSKAEFEIDSYGKCDNVYVSGGIKFWNDSTGANPVIKVVIADGANITPGNSYEIISAGSLNETSGDYTLELPQLPNGLVCTAEVIDSVDSAPVFKLILHVDYPDAVQNPVFNLTRIQPMPVQDIATISSASEIRNITVLNIQGQTVMQLQVNALQTSINMSHLNSGIYFARIETAKGTETRELIIK